MPFSRSVWTDFVQSLRKVTHIKLFSRPLVAPQKPQHQRPTPVTSHSCFSLPPLPSPSLQAILEPATRSLGAVIVSARAAWQGGRCVASAGRVLELKSIPCVHITLSTCLAKQGRPGVRVAARVCVDVVPSGKHACTIVNPPSQVRRAQGAG